MSLGIRRYNWNLLVSGWGKRMLRLEPSVLYMLGKELHY